MLGVKLRAIKYPFGGLWYDLTRDWTQVSQAIDKHSTHKANGVIKSKVGDCSHGQPEGSLYNS